MMQAGRDYGTRMMRAGERDFLTRIVSVTHPDGRPHCIHGPADSRICPDCAPFRSVNQDKPVLRLK